MPVRGAKPKPEGQARHRNKPAVDWTEIEDKPFRGKPPALPLKRRVQLPFGQSAEVPLQSLTKTWWKTISSMPHCVLWTDSDWQYAIATALVADAFHSGHAPSAAELDRREKRMGTTVDARRDLRIRYVPATTAAEKAAARKSQNVTSLSEYRELYD